MTKEAQTPVDAEVGVLLVHGIGDHAEGDTLLSFGEPMIDWLRDWLRGRGGERAQGDVSVVAARLRASRVEDVSPAYARVDIQTGPRSSDRWRERWLFTEAWWGSSVQVPPTARLMAWMLTRVPMLVHWHFYQGGLRHWLQPEGGADDSVRSPFREGLRSVPYLLQLAASVLIALLMQIVLVVALVLWLVPIGPWRQGLIAVVRALTLTLGDSYVLLEQEVQRAALVERVDTTLRWLVQRCERIVVVAHSQGGAIAYEALRAAAPRQVVGFISVGSGLEKLEFLRLVREQRSGVVAATLVSPFVGLAIVTLAAHAFGWVEVGAADGDWWLGPTLWFAIMAFVTWAWLQVALSGYNRDLADRLDAAQLRNAGGAVRWFDVHATMDLVPMGRASQLAGKPFVEQVEVTNECSLVHDHLRYFESRTGFLAWCWPQLAGMVSSLPLFKPADVAMLGRLQRQHRWRAYAFGAGVALAPAAIVMAMFTLTEGIAGLGRALLELLDTAKLDWVQAALVWLADNLARVVGLALRLGMDDSDIARRSQVLVGSLLALSAVTAWWLLCVSAWRAASFGWWRSVCRGTPVGDGAWVLARLLPRLVFWAALAALPLLALLVAHFSGDVVTPHSIGRATALLLAVGVFGFAAVFAWFPPWAFGDLKPDKAWFEIWGMPFGFVMGLVLAQAGNELWVKGGGPAIDDAVRLVLFGGCVMSPLLAATLRRLPLPDRGWLAALWTLAPVAAAIAWLRTADLQFAIGAAAAAVALVASGAMLRRRFALGRSVPRR